MKIEISEVFVTHSDAISTTTQPTPIGISGLDRDRTRAVAANKYRRLPLLTALSHFFAPKQKLLTQRHQAS